MPKRRAQSDSEDEASVSASSASKRARTEDHDEESEGLQQSTRAKGKASARRQVKEEEDEVESDDQDVNMEDEGNDEEFEQRYRDMVLAAMESKRKVSGVRLASILPAMPLTHVQGIAEHGIIEYIEMHQFMCHKYLTFHFGPQINFIIGASLTERAYIERLTILRRSQWQYVYILTIGCSL